MIFLRRVFIFICILCLTSFLSADETKNNKEGRKNEMIILLKGVLGNNRQMNNLAEFIQNNSDYYACHIDWKTKKGIGPCIKQIEQGLEEINADKYDKLHFFCFVAGGKLARIMLKENRPKNLGRVILVRSPLIDEWADISMKYYSHSLISAIYGDEVVQLGNLKYKDFGNIVVDIGILIETKPDDEGYKMVRKLKRKKKRGEEIKYVTTYFHPDKIMSGYTDYTYLPLSHEGMYNNPGLYLGHIECFLENGKFGDDADRTQTEKTMLFYPEFHGR